MTGQSKTSLTGLFRGLFTALGIVSLILGVISTGWLVLMMRQWALPWSSLAITAPPRAAGHGAGLPPASPVPSPKP